MRDEHYTRFKGSPSSDRGGARRSLFVMVRRRGDRTDSMRGSLRAGPYGWDAVYTLNGERYRSQWVAAQAFGVEAQILREGGLVIGRRFDLKAQAVRWAEEEPKAVEEGEVLSAYPSVRNKPLRSGVITCSQSSNFGAVLRPS